MALAYIRILRRGQQPGIDNSLPGGGNYPDQGLPGGSGGYPDQGLPGDQPGIDNELPPPPPGIWPPPSISHPIVPIPPGTSIPPGTIWPPPGGIHYPDQGLPGGSGGRPDNTLPGSQPQPDQGLPGAQPGVDNTLPTGPVYPHHPIASQTHWMLCYTPNLGWKYVAVDPSLKPGMPLPPTAQPKG